MKSVGEVLALGRSFAEAFGKAMAGRELDIAPRTPRDAEHALEILRIPSWDRYDVILWALEHGVSVGAIGSVTIICSGAPRTGIVMPTMAATSAAHGPAELTMRLQRISPRLVVTR